MRKPGRFLVSVLSLPLLAGCFTVATVPVPRTAPEREQMELRGVVVTDGTTEETLVFEQLHDATWTPGSLSVVADIEQDGSVQPITRLIPITALSGLLVRRTDAGTTSAIIGGAIVGTMAAIAFLVTGKGEEYSR